MGQKVNPHGLRVGVIKDWDSKWYADKKTFGDNLVEDYKIRTFLKKTLFAANVSKIEIERANNKLSVSINTARPGVIIGSKGSEIEKLKAQLVAMTGKEVALNIVEVKNPSTNAQLEKRISFRKAMKSSMQRAMKMGAKGIKTTCSGRLGGAEIARTEHYHEGTIPLQTLRADIDYGFWEANTTYGKIGVKVWIYKGEVLPGTKAAAEIAPPVSEKPRRERRAPRKTEGGKNNVNA